MPRSRKLFNFPDNHVYADGMTLKNVRDAVVAAGATGMWHVAWELAKRYDLQEALCMKCAKALHPSEGTYLTRSGQAMRFCLKCAGSMPSNH
jgi:hypothetical protein